MSLTFGCRLSSRSYGNHVAIDTIHGFVASCSHRPCLGLRRKRGEWQPLSTTTIIGRQAFTSIVNVAASRRSGSIGLSGVVKLRHRDCSAAHAKLPLWKHENVKATIGSYDGLTLDIFSLRPSISSEGSQSKPLGPSNQILSALQLDDNPTISQALGKPLQTRDAFIMYLPRGPFPGHQDSEEEAFESFLEGLKTLQRSRVSVGDRSLVVIKVNYRLMPSPANTDPQNQQGYPLPVFDVTWALDCIKDRYGEDLEAGATLSIYGRNFGGSLGLTLAFTEFEDIHAVAAADPTVDWTALDEMAEFDLQPVELTAATEQHASDGSNPETATFPASRRRGRSLTRERSRIALRKSQSQAAESLIDLRTKLFNTPSGFFDRFASPMLFLRAPGKDTPQWRTAKPEHKSAAEQHVVAAYGPYDDDWTTQNEIGRDDEPNANIPHDGDQMDTLAEAIGTDAIAHMSDTQNLTNTSLATSLDKRSTFPTRAPDTPETLASALSLKPVKRRKVLLRWPSISSPDGTLLPHIQIISTNPKPINLEDDHHKLEYIDYATVLSPQAKEMTEVIKRACFWGRGSDLADERVTFESVEPRDKDGKDPAIEAAVVWLHKKICEN